MNTTTQPHHSSDALSIQGFSHTQEESYIALFRKIFCQSPWFESWSEHEVKRHLSHTMKHRSFLGFTAFLKNEPIGFLTGYCVFDRVALKFPFYLEQLFVDNRCQHMGIGRALIKELMNTLQEKKIPVIILSTQENSPAEHFYGKHGFKKVQTFCRVRGKIILYCTQKTRREESEYVSHA